MRAFPIYASSWKALALLASCGGGLILLDQFHSIRTYLHWFEEHGLVETTSALFWLLAAITPWRYGRGPNRRLVALFSALFLCFALREYDMHKMFTSHSMLKLTFYTRYGWHTEQWVSLPVALLAIMVVVASVVVLLRYWWRGGWREASGQMLLIGCASMAFSKVLDRLPSVLRKDYQLALNEGLREMLWVMEEGLEMLTPLLFVWAWRLLPNLLSTAPTR